MYTSVDKTNKNSKVVTNHFSEQKNGKTATRLQDNRPQAILQKKLADGLADKENASAPVQRVISFKVGGQKTFSDIDHLKATLKNMYNADHHETIEELVNDTEGKKFTIGAVNVFDQINAIASKEGWERTIPTVASKGHGPSLPTLNSHKTTEDKEDAMSTFMFGSVTLAKAELMLPDKQVVPFQERQTGPKVHAEDNLMAAINNYLAEKKINPKECRLRITINNAPCGEDDNNCAAKLSNYSKEKQFQAFSVYYMKPYGGNMANSVSGMQNAKIRVANFSPKELKLEKKDYSSKTWGKIQKHEKVVPEGVKLDPWSDDEQEIKKPQKTKETKVVEMKDEDSESESDLEIIKNKKAKSSGVKKDNKREVKIKSKALERKKKYESSSSESEEEADQPASKKRTFKGKKKSKEGPARKKQIITYEDYEDPESEEY